MKCLKNSHLLDIESRFSSFNYEGYEENNQSYIYKEGILPILISAPHATYHNRNDYMKSPDFYTGSIGYLLHEHLGVHFIAKCCSREEDPNYDEISLYRDKIEEIVKKHSIALLIDLHGAKFDRPFCIDIGTADGKTAFKETITSFHEAFRINSPIEFQIVENHTFKALNPTTVTHDIYNRCGIETMQVEINKKYRIPQEDFESFITLLRNLTRFIQLIKYK